MSPVHQPACDTDTQQKYETGGTDKDKWLYPPHYNTS